MALTVANKFNAHSFNLVINKTPKLSEYVQDATLPGLTLGEAIVSTPFSDRKEPGDKILYSTLSVTFILDEELLSWREIYEWITGLGAPENFGQYRNFQSPIPANENERFSDAVMILYTSQQVPLLKINFRDLFPIALSEVPLTFADTDDQYVTATADFQYRTYDLELL